MQDKSLMPSLLSPYVRSLSKHDWPKLRARLGRVSLIPLPVVWLALSVLTLTWAAVGLADSPFWNDEAYTVLQVRAHDWAEFLRLNLGNEETPPLYYALLRLWAMLWGDSSEVTLRFFSACCYAATVPVVGWLGAQMRGRAAGIWAALLVAVSPLAHTQAQQARAYALALLLMSLLLAAAYRYKQHSDWRSWFCYVLVGGALLYTSYFSSWVTHRTNRSTLMVLQVSNQTSVSVLCRSRRRASG